MLFLTFVDELKRCNPDATGIKTSSRIFVFVLNVYGYIYNTFWNDPFS